MKQLGRKTSRKVNSKSEAIGIKADSSQHLNAGIFSYLDKRGQSKGEMRFIISEYAKEVLKKPKPSNGKLAWHKEVEDHIQQNFEEFRMYVKKHVKPKARYGNKELNFCLLPKEVFEK